MSIRQFVSGSSIVLAAWLGATFLKEVPADRYPKLGKPTVTTAAAAKPNPALAAEDKTELTVSAAR